MLIEIFSVKTKNFNSAVKLKKYPIKNTINEKSIKMHFAK